MDFTESNLKGDLCIFKGTNCVNLLLTSQYMGTPYVQHANLSKSILNEAICTEAIIGRI